MLRITEFGARLTLRLLIEHNIFNNISCDE